MTTIYSLSNIQESTDALSKGLLGFGRFCQRFDKGLVEFGKSVKAESN